MPKSEEAGWLNQASRFIQAIGTISPQEFKFEENLNKLDDNGNELVN